MYITQSDIELLYGVQQVAQWSSFSTGTAAPQSAARIAQAIAVAEAEVNRRLANGPYAIPITPADLPEIKNAAATLAGYWLWTSRRLNVSKRVAQDMDKDRKEILRFLSAVATGAYPLDAGYNTSRRNIPMTW